MSSLVNWEAKGEAVEFTFVQWQQLPKYRCGEKGIDADGHLVVNAGEAFAQVDHHFSIEFTVRSVSPSEVGIDYSHRHRRPGAGAPEWDTGHFTLPRHLADRTFDPAWRDCSTTAQCTIIPSYCGGFASVSSSYKELAENFYSHVGAVKSCSGRTMVAPTASCVGSKCLPEPRFP